MNRRLFMAGPALSLIGSGALFAAEADACCNDCMDCAKTCLACVDACLHEANRKNCIKLCLDCADICGTCARIDARSGPMHAIIAAACADACEKCATECEKHKDDKLCKACAEQCRKCAKQCRAHT